MTLDRYFSTSKKSEGSQTNGSKAWLNSTKVHGTSSEAIDAEKGGCFKNSAQLTDQTILITPAGIISQRTTN